MDANELVLNHMFGFEKLNVASLNHDEILQVMAAFEEHVTGLGGAAAFAINCASLGDLERAKESFRAGVFLALKQLLECGYPDIEDRVRDIQFRLKQGEDFNRTYRVELSASGEVVVYDQAGVAMTVDVKKES